MNALEMLEALRKNNPGRRFAMHRNETAIGEFIADIDRFVAIFFKTITGNWFYFPNGLKANGDTVPASADWIE